MEMIKWNRNVFYMFSFPQLYVQIKCIKVLSYYWLSCSIKKHTVLSELYYNVIRTDLWVY